MTYDPIASTEIDELRREIDELRREKAHVKRVLEEAKQLIAEIDAHDTVFAAMPWDMHVRIAEFQLVHP